jgi:transcriptional regulator with XRE-family HTH domain
MPKQTTEVDRLVGIRITALRKAKGLSQTALGNAVGVTFQQVQKYEKGANRISASRLQQIAEMLGVPIGFFYEGAPRADAAGDDERDAIAPVSDVFWTSQDLQLVRAFQRVSNPQIRRRVIALVESLGDAGAEE